MAVQQLSNGGSDGTTIGASASEKLSVYGETPVVQASAITAVNTTGGTSTTPFGFSTNTQADAVVTSVNSIITALANFGIIA